MEILKLPPGQPAPSDGDCIRIQQLADDKFELSGSVLLSCGDGDAADSVSLVGGEPYPSYDDAEAAGLAWAADQCVERVYVARSAGKEPLLD